MDNHKLHQKNHFQDKEAFIALKKKYNLCELMVVIKTNNAPIVYFINCQSIQYSVHILQGEEKGDNLPDSETNIAVYFHFYKIFLRLFSYGCFHQVLFYLESVKGKEKGT